MAHLTAVAEDVLAGTLNKPPTDEMTAAQVARFAKCDLSEILSKWTELAPSFEPLIASLEVWPAVLDVATHEQDIRGAVGMPGARDTQVIRLGAKKLISWLDPSMTLRVIIEDEEFRVGPENGPELVLQTDLFEAFRWRLGRRSRRQLAGLSWSGDPSAVLDELVVFGPSRQDVLE